MPAFIKTDKDEANWSRAKSVVHKQYPKLSEKNDKFWKLTTTIYKNISGKNNQMKKTASNLLSKVLRKYAYVPLTPAAEEGMAMQQQGMDPSMQGGDPNMLGGDPSMQGGDPSMQGGMPQMPPQIQTVPGPNGEPIDPETGFVVVDMEQGIEQDPLTGILFIKFTGEFMDPNGQPMDPEQAQMMIEEAQAQQGRQMLQDPSMQGGDPNMMGGDPNAQGGMPMDPSMQQGGAPMDPSMQGGAPMPQDPNMMMQDPSAMMEDPNAMGGTPQEQQQQGPVLDPQTGMMIDPNTGYFAQPGAGAAPAGGEDLASIMPGLEQFMDNASKQSEQTDKMGKRVIHDVASLKTDVQGLRREFQQLSNDNDTLINRLDNIAALIESYLGGPQSGGEPMALN